VDVSGIVLELTDNEVIEMRQGPERWGFWITGPDAQALVEEMVAWCVERHGDSGETWYIRRRDIWFCHESAAMEFKLRWL
jgi:hypothetical protein